MRRRIAGQLVMLLALGTGPLLAADEIHWTIKGQTAVTFDWRGPEDTIRFGISPGVYSSTVTAVTPSPVPDSSAGPFWEARLTGLLPDTLYYYVIGSTAESTFRTPPPRGTSDFWIAMQADIGSVARYPGVGPTQAQIASDNPNIPGDERPRFVMVAGDLTYGDQNGTAEVDNHFNDMMPWSRWGAYMPAWGNHDDGSSADDRQNYEGRFDFPNSQDVPNPPPAGGPGEEWMWFDYGNLRVITYPEPFSGAWSDWRTKADAIMAQAQADAAITFILTYGHRPPYSSGSDHGGDSTIAGHIAALKAKYSKYVLNMAGHTHHYERTDPAQTGGILHIISGGAGASLGGLDSTQPSWSVFRMDHFVNMRIHVTANRIDGYAVCGSSGGGATDSCAQGSIVDTWSIVSGATVNQAPNGTIDSPTSAATITAGQSVSFTGTGSDPDGNMPLTYQWSFGGGPASSTSQDPGAVTFATPGTYTVIFTVTDSLGMADPTPATRVVTVTPLATNQPPNGTIDTPAADATITAGQSLSFSGTGSDPDGNVPLTYQWSFGGGAAGSSAQDPGSVTFATAGVYIVTLTVSDSLVMSDPTPATRVVTVTPATTVGCTDYVSPTGSDNNAGTLTAPWRTVTFALGRLAPGDTLCLRGGTYYERPSVTESGTASARIVIQSFPGERAILDSGGPEFRTPGNSDWELVNAALGEYRSVKTFSSGNIYAYVTGISGYENERVGLAPYTSASAFRSTSDQYVDSSTQFYVGPGTFRDSDSRIHIRLSKTQDMRDMEARYGQVFPVDNADPRSYGIVLSNASSTLAVQASYVTIKDLTVHQALQTITLAGGVHDVTFDGITAWHGDRTISVGGSGVYNISVVNSRLYGDIPTWIAWSDAKSSPAPVDLWRGTTVNLNSGARDVRISYSHLRGGHDGIGTNTSESNITIDHNRIENFADDCMELEGTTSVGKISVYENYLGNCLVAIAPGQDTPSFPGPLLVYRNVVVLLRNAYVNRKAGINSWNGGGRFGYEYMFKHGGGSSYSTRNAHYYHNTLVLLNSSGKGINITPKYTDDVRIANNLMIMVNGAVNGSYTSAAGLVLDGDLYWKMNTVDSEHLLSSYDTVPAFNSDTGFESNGIGATSRRGTNPQFATFNPNFVDRAVSEWALRADSESFKPSDFMLAAGSPAIGAAIAIPAHPALGALPDTRSSGDIGAIPFGTPASVYDIFPFVPGGAVTPGDTAQPTVSITAPAGGATVSGSVTVTATASDNVGVAGVQFKVDGANLGAEDTTSPYSVPWTTATAGNGSHSLTALARDAAGNTRTSAAVSVTVNNADTTQPTVSITAPAGGATVSGSVTVTATASDNVGVAGVQFLLDGANLGAEDTSSPYSAPWTTSTTGNGSHSLTAVARDAAGNTRTSAAVSVTVNNADTTQPTVSITAPAGGATVSGSVTVTASASDNVGVAGVQFLLDGANLGVEDTSSPYSVPWTTSTTGNGSHSLTAVARDAAGNTRTSAAVSVTVNNADTTQPTVSITAPAGGATVSGSVTVTASASDNVGVAGVQFKLDGASLGAEDTSSPYSVPWTTATAGNGSHSLTAVARDAAGNTRTSAAVGVTVNNADTTQPTVSITAPAGGATVSGSVTVTASASDNVGVAGVQFLLDGANLGAEDTTSPYSAPWNTTTAGNGSHSLTAVARDAAGNTRTSSAVSVTVNNADTTQPSVSITAPTGGVTVSGSVGLSASASDNVGVVGVQFKVDGVNVNAEDTTSPYGTVWDTTTATDAAHTLTAVARDAAGNTRSSSPVSVTVQNGDTQPPGVLMTAPSAGLTVSSTITVTASATDNIGVVGVQFTLDGGNLGPEDLAAPYGVPWDTTLVANGIHTLAAVARDAAGNRRTATSITATVANADRTPPSVAITTPAPGVSVSGSVTVSASADDNVSVVGVQFQLDGQNLGVEVTIPPFLILWNTASMSGSHTITAVARDAAGNRSTSAGVSVNVNGNDRTAPAPPANVRAHGKNKKP